MIGAIVICINDENRPNDIPISKWIVKGNEYTVVAFDKLGMMNGEIGIQVAEIDLTGCQYTYFISSRFAFPIDGPEEDLTAALAKEMEAIEVEKIEKEPVYIQSIGRIKRHNHNDNYFSKGFKF